MKSYIANSLHLQLVTYGTLHGWRDRNFGFNESH